MTKEELQARLDACDQQFKKVAGERDELEDELKRLQGEYRGYKALIDAFPETKSEKGKK